MCGAYVTDGSDKDQSEAYHLLAQLESDAAAAMEALLACNAALARQRINERFRHGLQAQGDWIAQLPRPATHWERLHGYRQALDRQGQIVARSGF